MVVAFTVLLAAGAGACFLLIGHGAEVDVVLTMGVLKALRK